MRKFNLISVVALATIGLGACMSEPVTVPQEDDRDASASPPPVATVVAPASEAEFAVMDEAVRLMGKTESREQSAHGQRAARTPAITSNQATSTRNLVARDRMSHVDMLALQRHASEPLDRERYQDIAGNPVRLAAEEPVSTFSIDVDTGAYANVRRFLESGRLPPSDAVRIEEMINYFGYDYPLPRNTDVPFSVNTEVARAPWNKDRLLLQVGIKGYEVAAADRAPSNLVFLLDVSGSMNSPDKLPLLKNAFRLMSRQLDERDSVAIVVYAGASGVVLPPTPGNRQHEIMAALGQLSAGGSTNGAAGIRLAYDLAADAFVKGGINRVVLATDGDFNVGTVSQAALIDLIEQERERGISLTTLGFGRGNYNEHLMEQLADSGNGNYAYIDTLKEARKVLGEELSATLQTIAKDVKIQIEFNPALVAEYRLIGYENRMLQREDFNNDRIDAGEIGAGHTVTALYELTLADSPARLIEPLRYGQAVERDRNQDELAFVRLRYKAPDGDVSRLIEQAVAASTLRNLDEHSESLRFAAAVAAFGQHLRGGDYLGDFSYDAIADLAVAGRGEDRSGYRSEFLSLVRLAQSLDPRPEGNVNQVADKVAGTADRQAMR